MHDADLLLRLLAFTLFGVSLFLARVLGGRGIGNLPLWNGLGVLALYACYCFFGIRFNNGISGIAELIVAALVATSIGSFALGERLVIRRFPVGGHAKYAARDVLRWPIPPISSRYLWALVAVACIFYLILTQGQPHRLFTDGVGLKFERLQGIAEKSPVLLNLDALVMAMTLIALAWAIVGYQDDRRSKVVLGVAAALMLLYVLSTGSRTPLIAVLLQVLPAMSVARLRSHHMAWLSRKKWFFVLAMVLGVGFMILMTGSRMKFEELDDSVFYFYFGVHDFGVVTSLFRSGEATDFFLATAITYAASTFNNIVIRYQELDGIILSMGYKFLFYYISAFKILLPGSDGSEWRDLATTNKEHLDSISQAAGQWATPYGDLIWDFGVAWTFIIVGVFGVLTGWIIGNSRRNPSFRSVMWYVMLTGFSLSPLVNPLLSLYVHYILAILVFMTIGFYRGRPAPRIVSSAANHSV